MAEIDNTTGLPYLPPGQFWRVRERSPGWYDNHNSEYVVVELVERKTGETRRKRYFLGIPFGYETIEQTTEDTLAYQVAWDPEKTAPADREEWVVTVDGVKYIPITGSELKPEFILAAAEKALEWYGQKLKSEALLGDYPPKSLASDA